MAIRTSSRYSLRINPPPRDASFATIPRQQGMQGQVWSLGVSPYINDGWPPNWVLSLGTKPAWVSLTGFTVAGTPPTLNPDMDVTYEIVLILTHPSQPTIQVCAVVYLDVPDRIPDMAPVWSSIPAHTNEPGVPFSINLNNFVSGNPDPTITLETGTLGDYTLVNGVLAGTRPETDGTESFTFRATNSEGHAISGTLQVITETIMNRIYTGDGKIDNITVSGASKWRVGILSGGETFLGGHMTINSGSTFLKHPLAVNGNNVYADVTLVNPPSGSPYITSGSPDYWEYWVRE